MDFYFYFIEFSFPCLFNTTLLKSVGVNASKEAISIYFSSSSGERKIKRFSAFSAEEIKIENPSGGIYTAPRMLLWAHLMCQNCQLAAAALCLLPNPAYKSFATPDHLSRWHHNFTAQSCPKLRPGHSLPVPLRTHFQVLKQCFPSFLLRSLRRENDLPRNRWAPLVIFCLFIQPQLGCLPKTQTFISLRQKH